MDKTGIVVWIFVGGMYSIIVKSVIDFLYKACEINWIEYNKDVMSFLLICIYLGLTYLLLRIKTKKNNKSDENSVIIKGNNKVKINMSDRETLINLIIIVAIINFISYGVIFLINFYEIIMLVLNRGVK